MVRDFGAVSCHVVGQFHLPPPDQCSGRSLALGIDHSAVLEVWVWVFQNSALKPQPLGSSLAIGGVHDALGPRREPPEQSEPATRNQ